VVTSYRALRRKLPIMPGRHEDRELLYPLLRDLLEQAPGVIAIERGRLTGFLLAWLLPGFRGRPATYSPEWAHAAEGQDSCAVYQAMYAQLSARWVAGGYRTHLLTMLAHDHAAIEVWHWLGFGLLVADAVRDLSPIQGPRADIEIRPAGPGQLGTVMRLDRALDQHLAAAPIFRPTVNDPEEHYEAWLSDPARPLWLAYLDGQAVAVMSAGPSNPEACHVVSDPGTSSIRTAYTSDGTRERGIGSTLLNHLLAWARASGYERCAVDFETQNIPGTRFWLKYFRPVCYSLVRSIE
jgi:GNAT superfamily N-acetyltransferase